MLGVDVVMDQQVPSNLISTEPRLPNCQDGLLALLSGEI